MENFKINKLKVLEEIIKKTREIKGLEHETDTQHIKKIKNDAHNKDEGYLIHTNKFNVLLSRYWDGNPNEEMYNIQIVDLKNKISLQYNTELRNENFGMNLDPKEEILYVALKLFYEDIEKRVSQKNQE